jgi:putative ABC transport system permease protein
MMKAIGATFPRLLVVYFGQILAYALLSLLLALPLGVLGAHGLRLILIDLFNMEPGPMVLLPHVILVQVAIALISPLLVAIFPIFSGARITVREALSTYGLGGTAGLINRFLVRAERLPRTVAHIISNTFRNKSRVIVTQLTLVGSGLVFMMVMHTQAALVYTYGEVIFATFKANVFLNLEEEGRIEAVEEIALAHPEVTAVEMWSFANGTLRPADQPESNDDPQADIRGLPVPTLTYGSQMRAGRWLEPGDTYAMVLNQELAEKIGVGVGDWVTLNMPLKRETRWKVVGLLFEVFNEDAAHVPQATLLKELDKVGLASNIRIQTRRQDADGEAAVAAELRQFYEANGYKLSIGGEDTAHQLTEAILEGGISIVINLLAAMAVVIAVVGAVALSGVLSINILERRREIGVMRAIGASSFHIFRLHIGEGLLLGWLSWLIALPLSLPAGMGLTYALSTIMGGELSYAYSLEGILYWFGIVTVLSILASLLPARGATRISVRESLAYQ